MTYLRAGLMMLICMMGLSASVSAEFYRYTDENGVVRFTDNLAEIPPDQLDQVKGYKEPDDFLTPEQKAEKARQEAAEAAEEAAAEAEAVKKEAEEAQQSEIAALEKERDALDEERDLLDDEYAKIQEADKALSEERGKAKTAAEREAYNAKMKQLKQEIEDFVKKRNTHNEKVNELNQKIAEANKKIE